MSSQINPAPLCIPLYSCHTNGIHPVKNILILALSTFPYDGQLKQSRILSDQNDTSREYFYQLEPVPKMLIDQLRGKGEKLDEIIMLCTDAVYSPRETYQITEPGKRAVTGPEGGLISPIDYFVWSIKDYASTKGYEEQDIIFRDFGSSDGNHANTAQTISDILKEIRSVPAKGSGPQAEIFVDTHGGLRTTQELLNSILSLMQIEGIPIKYQNLFSVEYNNKNSTGKIIPAGEVIHVMDFVSGINECINYGRTDSLIRFYDAENTDSADAEIIERMTDVAKGIQLCNMRQFERALSKLSSAFNKYKRNKPSGSYLSSFLSLIESNYQNLLSPNRSVVDEIDWCTQKGFYQQALTLVESRMPEVIIKKNLLKGACFTEKDHVTVIDDSYQESIRNAKDSWQSDYNYIFYQYGFLCVRRAGQRQGQRQYLPISARTDYSKVRPCRSGNRITISPKNYSGRRENGINVIITESKSLVNQLIQLHMTLKNERNKTNHASSETTTYDISDMQHALTSYIEMSRRLGL